MSDSADISVLIVAFKSTGTLAGCLAALQAQTRAPREIIVLENGSPEGQRVSADDMPDGVRLVESDENLGFAGGMNKLVGLCGSRWIAMLNPDAYPHADWVEQLELAVLRYPDIALFGSTQYCAGQPGLLDGAGDVYHVTGLAYRAGYLRPVSLLPEEGEVFGPCGAAALVRKDVFDGLGGFDERLFCYNEDVDLAVRARLTGHRAIQLRYAAVDHIGYASSGRRSEVATYYGVRNRLWVYLKNMPSWLLWVTMPFHFAATLLLSWGAWKSGQFKLYWKAIFDCLKAWPSVMQARRESQRARTVSALAFARMMFWSSKGLLTRAPDVRPYDGRIVSTSPAQEP
ncbi:glycosyltransferase family 2 protein [Maricaulis sp.]|uniref:glycosyltransferase family 2 protein n=1 Tax=Maricaulis sp. TaxID=1486257 RepID=UPI0025C28092|nr:glycosyltransferase family 2 protein [Maricaulis sp.]